MAPPIVLTDLFQTPLIPAQAGIQGATQKREYFALDPRLRGGGRVENACRLIRTFAYRSSSGRYSKCMVS
jgi:hypothetical protein